MRDGVSGYGITLNDISGRASMAHCQERIREDSNALILPPKGLPTRLVLVQTA
jgi:hypothetical protein